VVGLAADLAEDLAVVGGQAGRDGPLLLLALALAVLPDFHPLLVGVL